MRLFRSVLGIIGSFIAMWFLLIYFALGFGNCDALHPINPWPYIIVCAASVGVTLAFLVYCIIVFVKEVIKLFRHK